MGDIEERKFQTNSGGRSQTGTFRRSFPGRVEAPEECHISQSAISQQVQALSATLTRLKERVADYETQAELAASTDFPAGE